MPSPGITSLKASLSFPYTIAGYSATIQNGCDTNTMLATGMHNGWTCASPQTPSTMETAIIAAFGAYVAGGSWGYRFLQCCGRGIDQEITAWVNSWDSNSQTHTFTVTAASIQARIEACSPITSAATTAMAQHVAAAFMSGFGQETG